jgi:hypothetical protein
MDLHVSRGWVYNGVGRVIRLDTTLTGDTYVCILADHLLPFMSTANSDGLGQFQQNNVRPHTSKYCYRVASGTLF